MKRFLENLSDELDAKFPEGYADLCIVFPTQRAGLFFKKHLSKKRKSPTWAPEVLSIENFFAEAGGFTIPDAMSLNFELFSVYKKYFPEESFDNYYFWGKMLLDDFEEIDSHLVDAKQLFRNVSALKEVDAAFGLSEEEMELIRRFWSSVWNTDKEPSVLKAEFLRTWKVLYEIYVEFRALLEQKKWVYPGMMVRKVAENPEAYLPFTKRWNKIIFAGLYDLSPAEEKFISKLVQSEKAICYWDSDSYYRDKEEMEAGRFFRKSNLCQDEYSFNGNYFSEFKKKIKIISTSHPVAQAKAAGQILSEIALEKNFVPEHNAFVLPEEGLLLPVLHSIPDSVQKINVTMGYPLKASPLSSLLEVLFSLQRNNRKGSFYHVDVLNLLNHPYIESIADERSALRNWKYKCVSNSWVYLSPKNFTEEAAPKYFKTLFHRPRSHKEIFAYLFDVIKLLRETLRNKETNSGNLEAEFIYRYYTALVKLEELFDQYKPEIGNENVWGLFLEIVSDIRIPFTGEPLEGLQVMGFLESRALDFKNVFLFSLNEGILPSTFRNNSFIPFNIKKAFGLNSRENHDSRYAYNFYRLIQRAENIYLFYNSASKSIGGGDKSRYILQLELELQKAFPKSISIEHETLGSSPVMQEAEAISVEKSPEVVQLVENFSWSASALSDYIACPLRFYLKKIAMLNEADEIEETMDGAGFGSVFHTAMEFMYEHQKEINSKILDSLKPLIPQKVKAAYQKEFSGNEEEAEGRNLLMLKVIENLVEKVLEIDRMDAPFRIFMAEKFTSCKIELGNGKEAVSLKGKIDRVDEKDDYTRIIDYKTGKTDIAKKTSIDDLFQDPKHQILFQTFFYGLMFNKLYPQRKIKLGIYPLKKISGGIVYPKTDFLQAEELSEFEEKLKVTLLEVQNPEIPFVQTDDEERCLYCSFKSMCNR